jgi:hypothetical protein
LGALQCRHANATFIISVRSVLRKIVVTLPALQVGMPEASPQGWDGLPYADVLEGGDGELAAEQAGVEAAAESLAPTTYADALGCDAVRVP